MFLEFGHSQENTCGGLQQRDSDTYFYRTPPLAASVCFCVVHVFYTLKLHSTANYIENKHVNVYLFCLRWCWILLFNLIHISLIIIYSTLQPKFSWKIEKVVSWSIFIHKNFYSTHILLIAILKLNSEAVTQRCS